MNKTKYNAVTHNGVTVSVKNIPGQKRPRLCLQFDGENTIYSVAAFKDEQTARWFCEVMEEFFDGIAVQEQPETLNDPALDKLISDIKKQNNKGGKS